MPVNARKPEILRSFQSGDALFSRFDGEWCLGFSSLSAAPSVLRTPCV